MSYIEFKNVCKEYKMGEITIKALNNTNFSIEKGELVVIVGPSGAGKTTALNILGGMDSATSGKVTVDGKIITNLKNKELIKLKDWPSEKIKDKNMVEDLIKTGVSELDERRWNDYVTGFTDNSQNITLDNLLKGKLKREEQENDRKRK